jgi:hypothetical protein
MDNHQWSWMRAHQLYPQGVAGSAALTASPSSAAPEGGPTFSTAVRPLIFDTSWAWLPLLPCPIPILRRTSDWGGWIIQETKTRPGKRYSSFLFPFRNKLVSLTAESKVSCRIQMGSNSLLSPFILLQRIFLFPKNQLWQYRQDSLKFI